MRIEDLGLIGNCQSSALVRSDGEIVWCCLPRFDSEPVFASLLDEAAGGRCSVSSVDSGAGTQRYVENTNVLETRFDTPDGSFRVIDFMPRFELHGRTFRPTKIVRVIEPIDGAPRVRVQCDPVLGWSRRAPSREYGSNHVSFGGYGTEVRVTTDVPVSYLDGAPFVLTQRRHLVLAWGAPVEEALGPMCDRFLRETIAYWRRWVKRCSVPPMYQQEVIRSALVLKLHCFEDTGAIIAATTTSLPEAPGSGRTWDYRYCWLRDAYYALDAFRLLGQFEEREQFVEFLLNVASAAEGGNLSPLYRVDGGTDLDERVLTQWPGYLGEGPVRVGNAAAAQTQHDVYGEMVLALAPIFLDDRFHQDRSVTTRRLLAQLSRKAIAVAGIPDAGIWEYRKEWQPQTFSSLMCWAAADRMATIARRDAPDESAEFRAAAERIHREILARGWSDTRCSLVGTYGGTDLDAALLQSVVLRFWPPDDPRSHRTIAAIARDLDWHGWLLRYRNDDGLGKPEVAFMVCTFWLVEALGLLGRQDEARAVMSRALEAASPLGLLAEDYDPVERRLWGNFPQAYSHVGLIHAAFAASPRWTDVL